MSKAADLSSDETERMVALARLVVAQSERPWTLAQLAAEADMSEAQLRRGFAACFGVSPKAFHDAARLGTLKSLLRSGDDITGAIFEAGYGSTSRFYERAARQLGMTASAYRAGGAGEVVAHSVRETAFGRLIMAATERGVCYAAFGDDAGELEAGLHEEYPQSDLQSSSASASEQLDAWIAGTERYLSGHAPRPDLPLDLQGTAFQISVWRYLSTIGEGQTVTYTDVARGVGNPAAVRAAGSACGKNRVAVLIPCHRVLRSDGGLGGYRWGEARKKALLAAEAERDPSKRS